MDYVWGHLVRKAHENGHEYFITNDLTIAIDHAWHELFPKVVQNLILSKENCIL